MQIYLYIVYFQRIKDNLPKTCRTNETKTRHTRARKYELSVQATGVRKLMGREARECVHVRVRGGVCAQAVGARRRGSEGSCGLENV